MVGSTDAKESAVTMEYSFKGSELISGETAAEGQCTSNTITSV